MSGLGHKKKIKATAALAIKPEETAIRPKPSMHATKRPPGPLAGSSTIPVLPKKPRLDFSGGSGPLGKAGPSGASPPRPQIDTTSWLDFCKSTTIDVSNFAETLALSLEEQKTNKSARLIAAVFRNFVEKKMDSHKIHIEYQLLTTCAATIKEHGEKLTNLYLHKCFLSLMCWMKPLALERQELISSLVFCLANKQANLDPYYISVFLHDSLGERVWVDKALSSHLLSLILKPFGTIFPTKEHYTNSLIELAYPEAIADQNVSNKFVHLEYSQVLSPVMDCLKKCWAADPPNRNVLRIMSMLAGIAEVRLYASKRMDSWSQNIKLQRHALELLIYVGCNFGNAEDDPDHEVLSNLLKLRSLKSKQVSNVFTVVLREIINRNENNLRAALNLIITNEFGPTPHRSPLNMGLLQMIFSFDNPRATRTFAEELSNLVIKREELAKHARLLTREVFRSALRNDFNYPLFAESYLNFIIEEERRSELGIEDHVVCRSATEVITMLPLVAISPQVKEASIARRNGQFLSNELQYAINKMEKDLSAFYDIVLKWLQYAKNMFMEPNEYHTAYYRYLYLEKSDYYTRMDQGPTETDFIHAAKIFGEFCFTDKHIKLVGKGCCKNKIQITGETFNTLRQEDTIQLVYDLARRSTGHRNNSESRSILSFVSGQPPAALAQRLLDVCIYRPNFLYDDELIPMFVSEMYWRSWIIIMLWGCCGKTSESLNSFYEAFPMFRFLVHVMLTKQYQFPVAFETLNEEEMIIQEKNITEKEVEALIKQENLFERKHNRDTAVTEYSSQLVKTCLIAQNCVRRVPEHVLQELRGFANDCHFVASLSESKNPDLLKKLIENYGAPKAMPAIQDLLATNAAAIDSLDILILCEFLVFHLSTDPRHRQIGEEKMNVISTKLRSCMEADATPLLFFLKKLSSSKLIERLTVHRCLIHLLEENVDGYFSFSRIEKLSSYENSKAEIGAAVANSLLFENDSIRTETAIKFVTKTLCKENMHQIAAAVSPLAERSDNSLLKTLIVFFDRYHLMCQEFPNQWPEIEGLEKNVVSLPKGDILMADGSINSTLKLLCKSNTKLGDSRENLIKIWFPDGKVCPKVTLNYGSPIDIFPESLRSKMLCAEDERITKVALQEVTGQAAAKLLSSFGLTNFSATQLMSVVDKMAIDEIGRKQAADMKIFVVAYKHRGAVGGVAFLNALKRKEDEEKAEKMKKIREEEEYQKRILEDMKRLREEEKRRAKEKEDEERKLKEIKKEEDDDYMKMEIKEELLDEPMDEPMGLAIQQALIESEEVFGEKSVALDEIEPMEEEIVEEETTDEECQDEQMDEEEEEAQESAIEAPKPIPARAVLPDISNTTLSKEEAQKILNEITNEKCPELFICPQILIRHGPFTEEIAAVCAEHFQTHLKFFLSNADAFHEMMSVVSNAANKFTLIQNRMIEITKKITKEGTLSALFQGYLKKFMDPGALSANAEAPKRELSQIVNSIERLVLQNDNPTLLKEEIMEAFSGGLIGEGIIAQIPQKRSPETTLHILKELLESFNDKYNPLLVCEFVKQCCFSEISLLKESSKLGVLAQYLAEMVIEEPNDLKRTIDIVDRLVSTHDFNVLLHIGKSLHDVGNSNMSLDDHDQVTYLIRELSRQFPCLHIDRISGEISLRGPRWRVDQGERHCARSIFTVLDGEEFADVNRALESLHQMVYTHPSLVIRDFGAIVHQLSITLEKDSREFKGDIRKELVKVIKAIASKLLPILKSYELHHVDIAISTLVGIYDKYSLGSEDAIIESGLAEAIVSLTFTYLENHRERARGLIYDHAPTIEDCCFAHREHPASIVLLDEIRAL